MSLLTLSLWKLLEEAIALRDRIDEWAMEADWDSFEFDRRIEIWKSACDRVSRRRANIVHAIQGDIRRQPPVFRGDTSEEAGK